MKQAREHGFGVGFMNVIMREREDVVDWLEQRLFVRIVMLVFQAVSPNSYKPSNVAQQHHLVHHRDRLGRIGPSHLGHRLWRQLRRRL